MSVDKNAARFVENGLFAVTSGGKVFRQSKNGLVLAPQSCTGRNKKYHVVSATINGKQKHFYVHRLVAKAFIKNERNLPQINHKDGNPHNNHFSNLEWCTAQHNVRHAYRNGLVPTIKTNGIPCKQCGESHLALTDGYCRVCKNKVDRNLIRIANLNKSLENVNISDLSAIDQKIVQMRLNDMSLRAIGRTLNISGERVRQRLVAVSTNNSKTQKNNKKVISHKLSKIIKQEIADRLINFGYVKDLEKDLDYSINCVRRVISLRQNAAGTNSISDPMILLDHILPRHNG